MPTTAARIERFLLAAYPNAYCTDCLSKSLTLDSVAISGTAALLGRTNRFAQGRHKCSLCGIVTIVTWANLRHDAPS